MARNLITEIENYLRIHDAISYGLQNYQRKFATIGIGHPQFKQAHSLILEKGFITDVKMEIKSAEMTKSDDPKKEKCSIDIAFSRRSYEWDGELDKVVMMAMKYMKKNTVIVGMGYSKSIEKKVATSCYSLIDAYYNYREKIINC